MKRRVEELQQKDLQESGFQTSDKMAREKIIVADRKHKSNDEQTNARIKFWKEKLVPADFETFFNGFKIMAHNWKELPE
jgi:hypothetical protein